MNAFLQIYMWPGLASLTMGLVLNLLGIQLASRDKSVQSLVMSQGAMFGVLLGIAFVHPFGEGHFHDLFPFVSSILGTAFFFFIADRVSEKFGSNRTPALLVIYPFLISAGYLLSALVPQVELHVTQKFFGDLATLSDLQSQIALVGSSLGVVLFVIFASRFTRMSFEMSVFGFAPKGSLALFFLLLEFFIISYSVLCFGFLYTVACLYTGTTVMFFANRKGGLRRHFILSSLLTVVGCALGFLCSLYNTRVPTVPAIVFATVLLGMMLSLLGRRALRTDHSTT